MNKYWIAQNSPNQDLWAVSCTNNTDSPKQKQEV
jgi:hypothetical protein